MKNKKNHMFLKGSSVFIATFSQYEKGVRLPTNGMISPLLSFFLPKIKTLLLVDQPHPISDTINPFVEKYKGDKLIASYRLSPFLYFPIYLFCLVEKKGLTRLSYKLRDFYSVIFIAFQQKENFNLFIGLEGINVIAGILLRKLGKVKIVIYYVSDYSPNRFGKSFLNKIYIRLDRFCVRHADFTWDVSPAMIQARLKSGLDPKIAYKVIHVPNALFPGQIQSLPLSRRIPNSLVYMGILDRDQGADLAIRSIKDILKKIPNITLAIVGGLKEDVDRLQKLVDRLKIKKHVIFYGFIPDNNEMAKIVRSRMVGLAPYRSFPDSFRWYGDAGKIRQYVASGLPVVTTHVPPLGKYIVEKGAGIMTNDTAVSFSKGIIELLSDDILYRRLSNAAEKISKDNTWENTYKNAINDMEKIANR